MDLLTDVIVTHDSSVAAQTDRVTRIADGMVIEAAIGYQ
jgi:ABC-type lipoprotein export system ATPase subunit